MTFPFPHLVTAGGRDTFSILKAVGAGDMVHFALDAGSDTSYTTGSQVWADLSPNGHDLYLGTNDTVQSTDPTFNGDPGALSENEYWSFGSNRRFTMVGGITDFTDTLHHRNTLYTTGTWIRPMASRGRHGAIMNTAGNAGLELRGVSLLLTNANTLQYTFYTGGSNGSSERYNLQTLEAGVWQFVSVSIDARTSDQTSYSGVNGQYQMFNGTPGNTRTLPAHVPFTIGRGNTNETGMGTNDFVAQAFLTEGQMTQEQLTKFYNLTRDRYGV
ncbi:MAG: hypothetical protein M0R03_16915 [Novosphingobium sp.]|nr:hypothetical protein [Novosphingobium sp.]